LEFVQRTLGLGLEQKLTTPRSPWQNPFVECLISSIRRECLDHVTVLHESHLRRRLTDYSHYYHLPRTHRSLDEEAPDSRAVEPPDLGNVIALPMVSGLHHRSARQAAA
jgi:putative transposase